MIHAYSSTVHSPDYVNGWDSLAFTGDTHVIMSMYLVLLCFLMLIALLLQHYWSAVWKFRFIPEAGIIILLGNDCILIIFNFYN